MKLFKNRRGNWADIFEYLVGAVVLGLVIFIVYHLLVNFDTSLNAAANTSTILNDTIALQRSSDAVSTFPIADFIIPMLYIFFLGFSVWSARRIQSSHLFIWLIPIMLLVVVLFSLFIEMLWQEFTTTSFFVGYITTFRITNFFLSQAKYFALFYSLLVGVSLYAKKE